MSVTTGLAIYFLIWWIVLFAVLPWGVRSQGQDREPGTDPGAPVAARIVMRLVWTTVVATAVFAIFAVIQSYRLVTLDDLVRLLGMPL